jgi:hypothetical protein
MEEEGTMDIEITSSEYRDLLEILHIADVIMTGHRSVPDKRSERHRALIQKIYGLAHDAGHDGLIRHDAPANTYLPTPEFEESSLSHVLINEFADHIFWDELISRLSVRDAAQMAGGLDRLNTLNEKDRRATEGLIRQRYIEEFSRNGMTNLEVVYRNNIGGETPLVTSD